ncbi:hypothetical protein DFS34DRAFT_653838 [Phlyctochytrium arcticum]|nr:hypothetical protein DFS34DRAFT_653838 [Phlyctochytrium arcticum]
MTEIWFNIRNRKGDVSSSHYIRPSADLQYVSHLQREVLSSFGDFKPWQILVYLDEETLFSESDPRNPRKHLDTRYQLDKLKNTFESPLEILVDPGVLPIWFGKGGKAVTKTLTTPTYNQKINFKSLMRKQQLEDICLVVDNSDVTIDWDDQGYSIGAWTPDKTYKLRGRTLGEPDEEESFSKIKSIHDLHKNFKNVGGDPLPFHMGSTPIVTDESRLEMSRRFIISLFMLEAMDAIEMGENPLKIDEEFEVSAITETKAKNKIGHDYIHRTRYHGAVDFVVRHTTKSGSIGTDTALVVIEVKRGSTFEHSEAQMHAQAASSLSTQIQGNRGFNTEEGRVFYIRTDAEQWEFGVMSSDKGGKRQLHKSDILPLSFKHAAVSRAEVKVILGWHQFLLCEARDSSPRSSW